MKFLGDIGIDYHILIAQIINFLALVLILWWLLYKPLVKMFEERESRTKKLATDLVELEQKKKATTEDARHVMEESEKNANEIMDQSRKAASLFKEEREQTTVHEVDRMMEESRARMLAEQAKIKQELRAAVAGDVLQAVSALFGDLGFDATMHETLMKSCRKDLPAVLKTAALPAGLGNVVINSARPLSKSDATFFDSLLKKKLRIVSALSFTTDPSLVAGVVLKFGSGHLFDFSFTGALEKKFPDVSRA